MGVGESAERAALVALLRARPGGMRWADITAEVLASGGALEVWHRLVPATLVDAPGEPNALDAAAEQIADWAEQGWMLVTILDLNYPVRLRDIHQAPPVLFARGSLIRDEPAVSVVGSRKASVIGTGINRAYPPENSDLQEEIASRGLLLSQFWPDTPPQKHQFPMRNATISGYGLATVVVEAGEHSGARGQARIAVEHGRPVILTDAVVKQNKWAQDFIGRPGVHIADGLAHVLDVIDGIIAERRAVGDELHGLVSTQA